jgi:hypothetical protein
MSANDEQGGKDRPSVKDQFQRAHSAHLASPALQSIWRNAYGNDYPEEANPTAFYSLAAELAPPTVEQFMRLARGMLADMPQRRYVLAIARLR